MTQDDGDAVIARIVDQARQGYHVRHLRLPSRFVRSLTFWAPSRFVSSSGVDVDAMLADLDETILARGMVLYDRQIITLPIRDNAAGVETVDEPPHSQEVHFEVPPRCEWADPQRGYFGLDHPYQMADDNDPFTWSHLVVHLNEPFLRDGELIAGLIHGVEDHRYLYCTCHFATVVYTTRHRLICISCGATHLVLAEPLRFTRLRLLTANEWLDFFDDNGVRRHEEVDLATIDFRQVENARQIWRTDQWEAAAHELIFFARSTPEEIEEAIRGTEADPSILLEAGFKPVEMTPPPAFHIRPNSVDVDLLENATQALREGVRDFNSSYVQPYKLANAVLDLFRCVELILKARLEIADATQLRDKPNNPTVLDRLSGAGVAINSDETTTIAQLRRLRNHLQHGTSAFNLRSGLALCRRAVVFIDRFVNDELGVWIGDVISTDDWQKLLNIQEVAFTAEAIVAARILPFRANPESNITVCRRCAHETLLRTHPSTGASCMYCRHVPTAESRRD